MSHIMFKTSLTIAMLGIITALSGCGRTGSLYIPEQRYPLPEETQAAPVVTPDNQSTEQ